MLTKLEQQYTLRAQDVDIKGEWMPSAIFVRMQEIAEDHAAAVGFGRVHIMETLGFAWVLTRLNLKMNRYPKLCDTITAATWPLKPTKLTFLRHFTFTSADDELLGAASSQWILFDIRDRMIRRTSAIENYPYDPALAPVMEEPGKIILPDGMESAGTRTVLYSDVDMNAHMNNTKYLNWICESYPASFLTEKRLAGVKINYIAEAYLDQQVELFREDTEAGRYLCGKTEEKTVFDAYVEWN